MFLSTRALFFGWSRKLKVPRANSLMISSYPVRFSTDTVHNNNISFSFSSLVSFFLFSSVSFAFCVYNFFWNKKYIFWYTFDYAVGKMITKFSSSQFPETRLPFFGLKKACSKLNYFSWFVLFISSTYPYLIKNKLNKYKIYFLVIKYFSLIF